jgi:hypothetical protein
MDPYKCQFITSTGQQCSRKPTHGKLCGQHTTKINKGSQSAGGRGRPLSVKIKEAAINHEQYPPISIGYFALGILYTAKQATVNMGWISNPELREMFAVKYPFKESMNLGDEERWTTSLFEVILKNIPNSELTVELKDKIYPEHFVDAFSLIPNLEYYGGERADWRHGGYIYHIRLDPKVLKVPPEWLGE